MEIILLLIRFFLFGVFALAAIGKFLDPAGSVKAVKDFDIPEALAPPIARLLPMFEIVIAASLLFVATSWFGAVAGLILLGVFITGMAIQMARGNAPDCHCFGQIHSEPVGWSSIVRNAGFAALAAFLVFRGPTGQGLPIASTTDGMIQTLLIIGVLLVAAIGVFGLKQLFDQQRSIIRRMELMEMLSGDTGPAERNDAGSPEDGLPVGAPFPEFALPSTSGKIVTFDHLLADGRPMLYFFLGPDCNPCKALYPDIEKWRDEFGEKIKFVLVSSGSAEDNAAHFSLEGDAEILIQTKRELAELVYAKWTPTAIFVSKEGNIASLPAAGDTAIHGLVDLIRRADLNDPMLYVPNWGPSVKPPKVGEKMPDFEIEDLEGRVVKSSDLRGKRVLAVSWSLTCPHCRQMMKEIREWEAAKGPNDPEMVIFSVGDREDHATFNVTTPILLSDSYELPSKMGIRGTPAAVLIDEEGTILTGPGIGAPSIWALIGRRNGNK
jgi:peroxiredoxin